MAVADYGNPPIWDSVAESTNPTAATVMADTGALPHDGIYEVRVTCGGSAAAQFMLQHRNAANGANVSDTVVLYSPAGQSGQYVFRFVATATGERFRVVMDDALTGTASVGIQAERLT
jgi:hypothetical protein